MTRRPVIPSPHDVADWPFGSLAIFPADPVTAALEPRTIRGMVAPFGVPGSTSAGVLTMNAGSIRLPADLSRVKLVDYHQSPPVAIGYMIEATETAAGIAGAFHVGKTPAGDLALLEAAEKLRDGLSVELHDLTVDAAGNVEDSLLTAVALLPVPAYADARVSDVAASLTPMKGSTVTEPAPEPTPADPPTPTEPATAPAPEPATTAGLQTVTPAAAPSMLRGAAPSDVQGEDLTELAAALYRCATGQSTPDLEAALNDIINTNVYTVVGQNTYAGRLWQAADAFHRRFVPLLTNKPLKSWKVVGWKFGVRPVVGDYAGDKANIPSNAATVVAASTTAARLAGGWDLDRKFVDFDDQEFISAFLEAAVIDYKRKTDLKALAFILASATAVDPTDAGGTVLDAAMIAADTLEDNTDGMSPDYYLVNRLDRRTLLGVTEHDKPAFMELFGVSPDKFIAHSAVPEGTVYAGVKAAASWYELGETPVRVSAQHIAQGGVDEAVFGYYATLLHDAAGIVKSAITP